MTKKKPIIAALIMAILMCPSHVFAGSLLVDGQTVTLVDKLSGKTFKHIYNAKAGTFGPARKPQNASKYKVLKNTASHVVFRGPRDTCTLTADHKFDCPKLGNGTWKVQ